jgi:phosphoglycerate dehydrogenase-like enzyme
LRSLRSQRERKWVRFPATLLRGKTVGIFGVGAIALELAPRCKAMGMAVVGITSARRPAAGFDRMFGRDELAVAVRDLDYLVLLTPYTPETRHIVNAAVFAAMKPACFLINLARGGVVDEAALIEALRDKRIAGAALDVFAKEPLPEDHPFWGMDNVIITTHQGGFFDEYPVHALPVVEDNLRKFLAGDLKNMVNIVRR